VSPEISLDFSKPKILDSTEITDSDHKILSTNWQLDTIIKIERTKRKFRKIFQYDKMDKPAWEDLQYYIGTHIAASTTLNKQIIDEISLNKAWRNWSNIVKQALNKYVPKRYKCQKQYYSYTFKATKLHSALKAIVKALTLINANLDPKNHNKKRGGDKTDTTLDTKSEYTQTIK
ncbi:7635_t:CDS:2, partial [Dentiscutata heterogama]